jgi:MFS family permease
MAEPTVAEATESGQKLVFWGCFIALVTTSFAFVSRITLCNVRFGTEFGLDSVKIGELIGAGIWPFAISIILFSLVIDRIGYKVAMFFSFACFAIYLLLACLAYSKVAGVQGEALPAAQKSGYNLLYLASIILALGNGTVEAFINPVVASMFSREKTKWLNILHAGWPGGLVFCGLATIALSDTLKTGDWRIIVGLIALPAVVYLAMLAGAKFPKSENEAAGVSYREMLGEFGAFGAFVAFGLIFMQLGQVFGWSEGNLRYAAPVLTAIVTVGFGLYTRSVGRAIMAFLIIIMMPLATTEIGTDAWISGLMEKPMEEVGRNPVWVLVYTSAIMMVLRFFAGPIVHRRSFNVRKCRYWIDFRGCNPVRFRKDIFLAYDARRDSRTMSERRSPDPECYFWNWDDCSRCFGNSIHRVPSGTYDQHRIGCNSRICCHSGADG